MSLLRIQETYYLKEEEAQLLQILVLSDTHVQTLRELPEGMLRAITEAAWVVHCGDYTGMVAVDELRRLARNFLGVYGNADPDAVRRELPPEVTLELAGRRIVVVHPHWGGHPAGLEKELVARFPHVDAILFGHTHDPCNLRLDGTLLLNPGQGYSSFRVRASFAILTVSKEGLRAEIRTLE